MGSTQQAPQQQLIVDPSKQCQLYMGGAAGVALQLLSPAKLKLQSSQLTAERAARHGPVFPATHPPKVRRTSRQEAGVVRTLTHSSDDISLRHQQCQRILASLLSMHVDPGTSA